MAVFIDRRQLFRTLGGCGLAAASGLVSDRDASALEAAVQAGAGAAATRRATFIRVPLVNGIIPHAGGTAMELYHKHPHDPREEVVQPEDIRLQTRLTILNHKEILDWEGLGWRNVVKLTRYQTRMEESPQIEAVLRSYFKDWWPAMTIYEVNGLSSPQARLEIDMWVAPAGARVVVG